MVMTGGEGRMLEKMKSGRPKRICDNKEHANAKAKEDMYQQLSSSKIMY
jgi:hypothetical protein